MGSKIGQKGHSKIPYLVTDVGRWVQEFAPLTNRSFRNLAEKAPREQRHMGREMSDSVPITGVHFCGLSTTNIKKRASEACAELYPIQRTFVIRLFSHNAQ